MSEQLPPKVLTKEEFTKKISRRSLLPKFSASLLGIVGGVFLLSSKKAKAQTWQLAEQGVTLVPNRIVSGSAAAGNVVSDVTLEMPTTTTIRLAISYVSNAVTAPAAPTPAPPVVTPPPVTCFPIRTPIRLHDGSLKNIEDVNETDVLISHDGSPTKVLKTKKHKLGTQPLFDISGYIKTTSDHFIMGTKGWTSLKTADFYEITTSTGSIFSNNLDKKVIDQFDEFQVARRESSLLKPGIKLRTILNEDLPVNYIHVDANSDENDDMYNLYTCKGSFVLGNGIIVDGLDVDNG